jgi:hypothetical protein
MNIRRYEECRIRRDKRHARAAEETTTDLVSLVSVSPLHPFAMPESIRSCCIESESSRLIRDERYVIIKSLQNGIGKP